MQLEAGQYFLKSLVSARGNSLLHFFKILTQMEVAFWSSEIALFKESFILAGGNGFRLTTSFVLLFGTFFCWWIQCLKLCVNQISSIFSIP